jgi:S-adenosylmethionine decarboxylase
MDFVAPTQEEFEAAGAWGLLTSIDLHDCNPVTIRDADMIRQFADTLCKRLAVKAYGEPQVVEFGNDPKVHGYSLTQLIESSLIAAHFAEQTNSVYLDIFSCKYYDPAEVVRYATEFFGGTHCEAIAVLRGGTQTLSADVRADFLNRQIILQPAQKRRIQAEQKAV